MSTQRCLIVGMGGISRSMVKILQTLPWFAGVGVVDISEAGQAAGRELLPEVEVFDELSLALKALKPDAVLINTPSELHFAQTKLCLEAGCHVLVAKPITNNFAEAVALVTLAQERGVTLSVGQQLRYNRHYTALARFVAAGGLGSVEAAWFMNSKPRPKVANLAKMLQPTLYENACHHFDAFLSVFASHDPEWIFCDGFVPSWSAYAGPCMVNALIGFSGGLHLSYHGGFSSQAPMYEFRLEGTGGALKCRGIHMSNDTMDYELAPALGSFAPHRIDDDIPAQSPWLPFFEHWKNYLEGGSEPPFSGRNNLKVFALLSAAITSVETGQRVRIKDNPLYAEAFV